MKNIKPTPYTNVEKLYAKWGEELGLELVAGGKGLNREIRKNKVQKPGLRIVETSVELEEGKVQVLGWTEIEYFEKLSEEAKGIMAQVLARQRVPCYIVSKSISPPPDMAAVFETSNMPLFTTPSGTGQLISLLNSILDEQFAPTASIHGLLIDINSLGVLITGESGVGKSESALDLIMRGSKLVADDVVLIRKVGDNKLIGTGPGTIKHLMEIRGIGIINIKDMFGTTSVLSEREIELVIELKQWDESTQYERLGLDNEFHSLLGINIPYCTIPVSPGRNMATIIEVAARNHLLKASGMYPLEDYTQAFESRNAIKKATK